VELGQPGKDFFAGGQEVNAHNPVVTCGMVLANQPAALGALDKPNHGVVALLQEFGQFGDRGPTPVRKPCNPEKQLVLLGCKAV